MSTSDTKRELLDHLDKATREMALSSVQDFSTARIAADINVSRNLASQYLNELVREGLAVKVNSHPVLYFHKRGLERYLQAKLGEAEYPSMTALLGSVDMMPQHDFEKAIGSTLSLSSCIAQLKSAVEYPPVGLPVLLVGEVQRDAALAAVDRLEVGRAALRPRWTPAASVVPGDGPLDLDHGRAEVGQQHGRVGTGQHPAEVRHDHAVHRQRPTHR